MFTTNHFIWLGIAAVIICSMLFFSIKFKWKLQTVLYIMTACAILSEGIKMMTGIIPSPHEDGGFVLKPGALPLHLCSIQIFLIFIVTFTKNKKLRETIFCFMFPTMMIGAAISLFIPTVGVRFNKLLCYQYFGFHAMLVFFGIYLLVTKRFHLGLKEFFRNYLFLFCLMIVAMYMNSILSYAGANFFYLTRPPMENLPVLNLDNGWYAYFVSLVAIALTLLAVVQLPVFLSHRKRSPETVERD